MTSTLQAFLKRRLIDIDADDEQFKNMEKAAAEVAKTLRSKRIEIVHHTLVALDPQVPPDEPRIVATFDALQKFWKAAPKRYPSTPVTELRAIIAEALRRVSGTNDADATLVSLTASSYVQHAAIGEEESVWQDLLAFAIEKREALARQLWGDATPAANVKVPSVSIPALTFKSPAVDTAPLQQHLWAAAGSAGGDAGAIRRNSNPPGDRYGNANSSWVESFGTIAARGISTAINQAAAGLAKGVQGTDAMQAALQRFAAELADSVTTALGPLRGTSLRTQLLWWRESRYSPLLRTGYSAIDAVQIPLAVALDLNSLLPAYTPRSVDFFMTHVVDELLAGRDTPAGWTMDEYAGAFGETEESDLIALIPRSKPLQGRTTLLAYLRETLAGNPQLGSIRDRLGLDPSVRLSPAEIGAWVFRDLQAERIAAERG